MAVQLMRGLPEKMARRTNEQMLSYEDDGLLVDRANEKRGPGTNWHHELLLSHCIDKDPMRDQQDDGRTGNDWPVQDSALRPKHGGPVVSTKENK